jgi:GNAT superfamily N-acetyltransferase
MMRLTPALGLDYATLAELFTRSFAGYPVPVAVDATALEYRARMESIDLAASSIIVERDEPVGVLLISRRGRVARVASMALVESARGRGLGKRALTEVIAQCRARGDTRLVLEVLETNDAAVALYLSSGFLIRRRLVGWSRAPERGVAATLVEVEPAEVARVMAADGVELPWQLSWQSIAQLTVPHRAFRLDDAYCIYRITDAVVLRALVVPQAVRRQGRATRLLRAIAAAHPDLAMRVTAIVPETPSFFGFTREPLAQHEMELML